MGNEKLILDEIDNLPGSSDRKNNLQRKLTTRHLTMISLGGTIGTGLFLASGSSIATAGPGGALTAYASIGLLVFFMMSSLGEMASYIPVTGSFNAYSSRFIDPALGFAMGWNYWYSWAITLSTELTAISLIMAFWLPDVNSVVWSAVCLVIVTAINLLPVRTYGESEYWFSLIKVIAVVIFIICGILLLAGAFAPSVGMSNWKTGHAFENGFLGVLSIFLLAGFSFQGTELVGIAAGESANPRRDIPKAVSQVFWRILLFYVLAIFIIGSLVPFDSPALLNSDSSVAVSPFTLVFVQAGWGSAAHVINAIILVTILSAGSSSMYSSSRTLYNLALENKAPRFFRHVDRHGTPWPAVLATAVIGMLAFLTTLFADGQVYTWLLSIASSSGFIAWLGISITHYRFRRAYVAQGRDLAELPYRAMWFPFGPIFTTIMFALVIIGQGYVAVGVDGSSVDVSALIAAYISIPAFFLLWIGYKLIMRTKMVPLMEVDLDTGRVVYNEEYKEDEGTGIWAKIKRTKAMQFLDHI